MSLKNTLLKLLSHLLGARELNIRQIVVIAFSFWLIVNHMCLN